MLGWRLEVWEYSVCITRVIIIKTPLRRTMMMWRVRMRIDNDNDNNNKITIIILKFQEVALELARRSNQRVKWRCAQPLE